MMVFQYPWDTGLAPAAIVAAGPPDPLPQQPKRRGRRKAAPTARAEPATPAADWLFHHLTISGPDEPLRAFATAARGSGVIPWQLDYAALEEDVFVRAVSQPPSRRTLTVAGCRILARQFRDRVAAHQARAAALVGQSQACPFDLHTLLPVPATLLERGPTDPAALAWLTANWGVSDRLHQVAVRHSATMGRRLPNGHDVVGYGFFTAGETPHAALVHLAGRWPRLRFRLLPRPAA